jgi:hypothetical protein
MLVGLLILGILIALVGGKAGAALIKGILLLTLGSVFLMAGCSIL